MEYKMIVSDLDRTLLNDNKEISTENLKVLHRCKELGYKVVFATARPKRGVEPYLKQLELDGLIVHNGAGIYKGNEVIDHIGINKKDIEYLISIAYGLKEGYGISIEMNDVHYANFDVSHIWKDNLFEISEFKDLPGQVVDKMIIHIEEKQDIEYFESHLPEDLYFEMSEGLVGLIMNKKATKLNAVKKLCKVLNIDLHEVIAFGDDLNDISLLKGVGMGVAVSNAEEQVKKAADMITLSNQQNGVAEWLKEHVL